MVEVTFVAIARLVMVGWVRTWTDFDSGVVDDIQSLEHYIFGLHRAGQDMLVQDMRLEHPAKPLPVDSVAVVEDKTLFFMLL